MGVILGNFCDCLVIMLWSVWARLGRFWDHVDELLGTFGTDLGPPPAIWRSFCGHFESILGLFRIISGLILDHLEGHLGVILESF